MERTKEVLNILMTAAGLLAENLDFSLCYGDLGVFLHEHGLDEPRTVKYHLHLVWMKTWNRGLILNLN